MIYFNRTISCNSSFIGSINIPSSLTMLTNHTLSGLDDITEITIPSTVTSISRTAFENSSFESIVFEETSGWTIDGEIVDVSDSSTNASNLIWGTYSDSDYDWNLLVRS